MNRFLSFINKYANLRNALIVTAFLFLVVVPINNRLTDSLQQLAHGESKLDFHKTYGVTLVRQLFDAYGKQGRAMYAWDLLVDTFYPLAVAGAAMLFALTVVRKPTLQKFLIVFPMIFLVTDVIECAAPVVHWDLPFPFSITCRHCQSFHAYQTFHDLPHNPGNVPLPTHCDCPRGRVFRKE